MTNQGFKIVEEISSADFVFDAVGQNLEELFFNCARACFFAMTDLESVEDKEAVDFAVMGDTSEDLLYSFISELIFLKDTRNMFFSQFDIEISRELNNLKCTAFGEKIDFDKHVIKTDVKAATYHDLQIRNKGGRYLVRMILDL